MGKYLIKFKFKVQEHYSPGVITAQTGPFSYTVQLDDQCEVCRHQDQVIQRAPQVSRTELKSMKVKGPLRTGTAPSGVSESRFGSMEENRQADPNLSAQPVIEQHIPIPHIHTHIHSHMHTHIHARTHTLWRKVVR